MADWRKGEGGLVSNTVLSLSYFHVYDDDDANACLPSCKQRI